MLEVLNRLRPGERDGGLRSVDAADGKANGFADLGASLTDADYLLLEWKRKTNNYTCV